MMAFAVTTILVAILLGVLNVPCTPPTERAMCKKEIGRLRGYLLCDDFYGISFFPDYFTASTNRLELRAGEFCDKVNQIMRDHTGNDVFRVVSSPDEKGMIIIDRWGTPYNFCTVAERQTNDWAALIGAEISNIVIWSSGPNRLNEYGLNDDVVLQVKSHLQIDEKGAKEP